MPLTSLPDSLVKLVNQDDVAGVFAAIDSNPEWKQDSSCLQLVMKKAATNGKMKVLAEAVNRGAKPDVDAAWNAAYCEYWEATKFCLDHGVTLEALSAKCGNDLFAFFGTRGMIDGVLYVAEKMGRPNDEICFKMLLEASHTDQYLSLTKHIVENWGFDVSKFQSPQYSVHGFPQHHACECGAIETLKYLLSKGANVNATTKYGYPPGTPLVAIFSSGCNMTRGRNWSNLNSAKVFEFICSVDGFDINLQDEETGNTALHSLYFMVSCAKPFLMQGADLSIKNKEGKTVLDVVDEKLNGALFEEAQRFWKLYKLGKVKIPKKLDKKRKTTEPGDDDDDAEPDAKRSKVEVPVPLFHTVQGARKMESGGWCHTLGDTEIDEDDTGEYREDKGATPLSSAIHEDLATLDGEAAELARRLVTELEGAILGSETDSQWTPFVITVPDKFKKATVIKLVQLALRAPKAPLKSTKMGAKAKSFFQEDNAASEKATATFKENLTGIVQLEYKGEPICAPVIVVGKMKGGSELVGAFALRVWT